MATTIVNTYNTTVQNGSYDTKYSHDLSVAIREVSPTTNYWASNTESSDYTTAQHKHGLYLCDISNVPAEKQIDSATLYLYLKDAYGSGTLESESVDFFRVKRNWVYNQVTWDDYATSSSWQTAGGLGANDIDTTKVATMSLDATVEEVYKSVDVTTHVQDIYAGTYTNYGLLFVPTTDVNLAFWNRWNTDGTRSELFIVYSDASVDDTATPAKAGSSSSMSSSSLLASSVITPAKVSADASVTIPTTRILDSSAISVTVSFG